ncbi:hypothetical protein CAPTEDRAFT_221804 [Capitella teleta]|uniref:Reelin domain-containing protein n=1 Tax=Capitella teleta TaxID=283909 RepID=R7UDT3_CAPTE|nr:hypothetical protein CAPTEDRAFT_221804 [Capitella teleta]|eukprot:ELU04271.1 hypothetical protein CAPTEDRAFT_221804 [Capitella teleta]
MKSIVAVLLMATACAAYKAGPPLSRCNTMMPKHGNATSQGLDTLDANFRVTTDTPCFKEGTQVIVTITNVASNVYFEGFFVQAREVGKTNHSHGEFDKALNYPREFEGNVQTIDCFGNAKSAIGHKGAEHQTMAPLSWIAPSGLTEDIEFVSTIVFHKETFWTDIKTPIKYDASCNPTGSAARISGVAGFVAAVMLIIQSLL